MARTFRYVGPNWNSFWFRLDPLGEDTVRFRLRVQDPGRFDLTLPWYDVTAHQFFDWLQALDQDHDTIDAISRGEDELIFPEPEVRWLLPGLGLCLNRIDIPGGPCHDRLIWSISHRTLDGDPAAQDTAGIAIGVVTGIGGGRRLARDGQRYLSRTLAKLQRESR